MAIYNNERDPNDVMWEKHNNRSASIVINKEAAFKEVWYEGYVEYEEIKYYFWLIDPQRVDENGEEYEIEVRWFFKRVPREVRAMTSQIIEAFKTKPNDRGTSKTTKTDV